MRKAPLISVAVALVALALALALVHTRRAHGYIEVPYTLGKLVNDSTTIVYMRVEKVDREKNTITYRKIEDIKGKHPTDEIKHNIAKSGFHPREWQNIMAWAEVGKTAVFMHNNSASETCIDMYWYQCYPGGEWWNMWHAEPFLLRSFAGKPDKLAAAIKQMLAGQEVVVPCMVDGDKNAIALRTAKVQRIKASLTLQDYNTARDFVGWGGEELRVISDMPGFTHLATIINPGGKPLGAVATHLDGDNKLDATLYSDNGIDILQNAGLGSFNELNVGHTGGARGAAWSDYNASGKHSLLLASPAGPRLFTNLGNGKFRDDSALLPKQDYWHLTAAAWIDIDGIPAILLADGFKGLRLFINKTPRMTPTDAAPPEPLFEELSEQFKLGEKALYKSDLLLVADIDADNRPDFLFGNNLYLNTGKAFELSVFNRLTFSTAGITPIFVDINGDTFPDLIAPQPDGVRVFQNNGRRSLIDVTAQHPVLATIKNATSVVAIDFLGTGRPDLFIGCTDAPNRFLANTPTGFSDQTQRLGLHRRLFNTRALIAGDFNNDRMPDLLMHNINQDPVLLLGNADIRTTTSGAK